MLSLDHRLWERELLAVWFGRADVSLPTDYALVFPLPADADNTAVAQILIEQQSEPFLGLLSPLSVTQCAIMGVLIH